MTLNLKVFEIFDINKAIENLIKQDLKYNVKVGYEIHKMKKQLDDIERYVVERLCMVIDNDRMRSNNLTNEERLLYNTVMESEMEITPFNIERDDIFNNENVMLTVKEVADIDQLFIKKTDIN